MDPVEEIDTPPQIEPEIEPPKKRGRPKKDPVPKAPTEIAPKKRGRPKKEPAPKEPAPIEIAPKKRGPKKEPAPKEPAPIEPEPPKKRGRPKKEPAPQEPGRQEPEPQDPMEHLAMLLRQHSEDAKSRRREQMRNLLGL